MLVRTTGSHRPTYRPVAPPWVAWHSKVRIAVLTAALFMALC